MIEKLKLFIERQKRILKYRKVFPKYMHNINADNICWEMGSLLEWDFIKSRDPKEMKYPIKNNPNHFPSFFKKRVGNYYFIMCARDEAMGGIAIRKEGEIVDVLMKDNLIGVYKITEFIYHRNHSIHDTNFLHYNFNFRLYDVKVIK